MAADTQAMHDTAALLDLAEVERAAAAIAAASRVDIYGASGSALVGGEMQFSLHRIGVAAWAWTDVHNGLASAALLRRGDVALGISHSGQTRETIEMLAEAGSHGATTVALTSFPRSPLAEVADIVLLTASQATTFRPDALSARHPQLVVLDLLYIAVAQRTHDRAHAAFQRTAQAVAGHKTAREVPRLPAVTPDGEPPSNPRPIPIGASTTNRGDPPCPKSPNPAPSLDRRTLLGRAAAAGLLATPAAGLLSACASSGDDDKPDQAEGEKSADEPVGRQGGRRARGRHLQRWLRHQVRHRRARAAVQEDVPQGEGQVLAGRGDRHGPAAAVRRRQPAGLREQRRLEADGLRRAGRRRPARRPDRAVRRAVGGRPGKKVRTRCSPARSSRARSTASRTS